MSLGMAVRVEDGIDVGAILRRVLAKHDLSFKAVWLQIEVDGASFSRALVGQQPLDLWRLRKLDARVFVDLLTALATAVVAQWFEDVQVPLRMAKVDPESVKKERVS